MKKILFMLLVILACQNSTFAGEDIAQKKEVEIATANQEVQANDNKVVVVVQKVPINEATNQKVILKKNWLGVYIQINGKVKVNPLTNTYEVE